MTKISANELNSDLEKVSNWTFRWEMCFNLDPIKQSQQVILNRKLKKAPLPPLLFNNVNVSKM